MDVRELRKGSTVQDSETKKERRLNLDGIAIIDMYCDKPGCPYEPKPITDEWLEEVGFLPLHRDEGIFSYRGEFFLAKTSDGYLYMPFFVDQNTVGKPKKFCHEIENLYHDIFGFSDTITG